MMGDVAHLWRHPIKSHGRERLESVELTTGKCMPWDRHWAVEHELSKFDGSAWASCQNFMIGTRTPALAAIWARFDETDKRISLRHPELGEITFDPDGDTSGFLAWIAPLCPTDRARPKGLVFADDRGMTDTEYASVSIMNTASHADVEEAIGHKLAHERWRGNIWLDGLPAWDEFNWIGKTLRIGKAELTVRDRIERCMHTAANPLTGARDADTLGALESNRGHKDFGIYAEVTRGGKIAIGDTYEVL